MMMQQQQQQQHEEQQQQQRLLPMGYKFLPTDRELLFHFLKNKLKDPTQFLPAAPIHDIQLYDHHPRVILDQLGVPAAAGQGNNKECYVFTMRSRKYLGSKKPNRVLKDKIGYWRASYNHEEIQEKRRCTGGGRLVGERMNFAFYESTSTSTTTTSKKKGIKTDWLMSEYRIKPADNNYGASTIEEELVLCRIYVNNRSRNNDSHQQQYFQQQQEHHHHQQQEQVLYIQQQQEHHQEEQPAVDDPVLMSDGTPVPSIDMNSFWEEVGRKEAEEEQQQNGATYSYPPRIANEIIVDYYDD